MEEEFREKISKELKERYRNEMLIRDLAIRVKKLFLQRNMTKDPNERQLFQGEIDSLYRVIYEELKKPSFFYIQTIPNPKKVNLRDVEARKRTLQNINRLWGEDAVQFYQKYRVEKLVPFGTKEGIHLGIAILIFILLLGGACGLGIWIFGQISHLFLN